MLFHLQTSYRSKYSRKAQAVEFHISLLYSNLVCFQHTLNCAFLLMEDILWSLCWCGGEQITCTVQWTHLWLIKTNYFNNVLWLDKDVLGFFVDKYLFISRKFWKTCKYRNCSIITQIHIKAIFNLGTAFYQFFKVRLHSVAALTYKLRIKHKFHLSRMLHCVSEINTFA